MQPLRRRRRDLVALGRAGVKGIGLPVSRSRELAVAHAWYVVAGSAIAQRAAVLGVKRGVLEIAVSDPRWAATLRELVPQLAGRLAARFPELGVKRFRLRGADGAAEPALTVAACAPEPAREPHVGVRATPAVPAASTLPAAERLARAAEGHLRRTAEPQKP